MDATTDSSSTSTLHSLPAEVIERILTYSDPRDVSRYARTCRFARKLVYDAPDQFLWRELYLGRPFDDLRNAIPLSQGRPGFSRLAKLEAEEDGKVQWQSELQRRTQAELIAGSGTRDPRLLRTAYEAFLAAIDTASPVTKTESDGKATTKDDSASRSENIRWLDRILRKTRVLDLVPAYTGTTVDTPPIQQLKSVPEPSDQGGADAQPVATEPGPRPEAARSSRATQTEPHTPPSDAYASDVWVPEPFRETHQMRSRLRACVALSHENSFEVRSTTRMAKLRTVSRAFVYDMRKYQQRTIWGPYRMAQDGRTLLADWEHVEHIMNVVGLKLREIPLASLGYYRKPLFQMEALRAYSAVGAAERPEGDWAGVTGKWRRFVCFMDYRDLYMFNYSLLPPGPHDPSFFDDPFDEALRPVELQLVLISREEYLSEPRSIAIDPSITISISDSTSSVPLSGAIGDCEDPAFPTLYFKGVSYGATATVRGKVSTLSDGAVRWQFVTTYDGRLQWSAEAIQVGHVCSAAGVTGIWTGAHHDRDDPAGPFWMVKY